MTEKRLYTADLAALLGVSRQTAARYMDSMPCVYLPTGGRRGNRYVVESDFRAWEAGHKAVKTEEKAQAAPPRTGRRNRQTMGNVVPFDGRIPRKKEA